MISDKDQTKLLRQARVDEKRQIKDLNQIGKRLQWIREKLDLSQRTVCIDNDIPPSTYCGLEGGIRAELVEVYLVLANYFNILWKDRFAGSFPLYNGCEIKKITFEWILFGHNDSESNAEVIIQEYQIKLRDMEQEYFNKEAELLKQLDMFAGDI